MSVLELTDGQASGARDDVPVYERTEDFESFYRRELPSMRVLARVLAGPGLAAEVAQETMLVAYRRWDELRCRRSPATWMRALCMEEALRARRRWGREARVLRALGSFRGTHEPRSRYDVLWHAVRTLPEPQAEAIAVHYALGLPAGEAAEVLGKPEDAVVHEIADARAQLASRSSGDPAAVDRDLRTAGEDSRQSVARTVNVDIDLDELRLAKVRRRRVRLAGVGVATMLLAIALPFAPGDAGVDEPATDVAPGLPAMPVGASRPAGHTGSWRGDGVDR